MVCDIDDAASRISCASTGVGLMAGEELSPAGVVQLSQIVMILRTTTALPTLRIIEASRAAAPFSPHTKEPAACNMRKGQL
jgi:hypothetical protein